MCFLVSEGLDNMSIIVYYLLFEISCNNGCIHDIIVQALKQ